MFFLTLKPEVIQAQCDTEKNTEMLLLKGQLSLSHDSFWNHTLACSRLPIVDLKWYMETTTSPCTVMLKGMKIFPSWTRYSL